MAKRTSYELEAEIQKTRPHIKLVHSTYVNSKSKVLCVDEKYGEWWAWPRMLLSRNTNHKNRSVKYTAEEVDRIVRTTRPHLKLDHSTYSNSSTKALFRDDEHGDWWVVPISLIRRPKSDHPQRSKYHNKYTPAEIEKKIQEERPHISLDYTSYSGMYSPAKFFDEEYGVWESTPASVLRLKTNHPDRCGNRTLSADEINRMVKSYYPNLELDISTYKNTHTKCRFIDIILGDWIIRPNSLLNKRGKAIHPSLLRNKLLTSEEVEARIKTSCPFVSLDHSTYVNTTTKARFVDDIHGEWWAYPFDLLNHPRGHNKRANYKGLENFVSEALGLPIYGKNVPQISDNIKPDFKITDQVYLEADGIFWHSELMKTDNRHHLKRREIFQKNGLRLVQLREDELHSKTPIIKSIINNIRGQVKSVYARKCDLIGPIPPTFFEENHLMGFSPAASMGLQWQGDIICAMSYIVRGKELFIHRYCNLLETTCVGGFSKLLQNIIRSNTGVNRIVSFVDLRYATGESLVKCGFTHEKTTLGWKWTDGKATFNRLRCRANMDDRGLTEREHAAELGWYKIYDAGQAKYTKNL